MMFMQWLRPFRRYVRLRSYGKTARGVQGAWSGAFVALACFLGCLTQPARAETIKIVALGDSLTAGFELSAQDAFPAKLQAALRARGHDVLVENAGVSGDTASGGLSRVDWSVPDGTQAVILELGANDMLRGIDPQQTRAALEGILTRLKERQIPVLVCGMLAAPNLGGDFARRYEPLFAELAARYDAVIYPFFLEGVAGQRELSLRDGLHPNASGVDTIVRNILPKVEELLGRAGQRKRQ